MAYYTRIASAIYNDVYGGLKGYHLNLSLSMEQLEDEVCAERLALLKELTLKGTLPKQDFMITLNCIPVDCKDLENCSKCLGGSDLIEGTPTAHFEIPLLMTDFGGMGIEFIGTVDHKTSFKVYTSLTSASKHKYRKRRKNLPYVFVNTSPNENNMFDCYLFNAPMIKVVSVTGIFKDIRLVENYGCDCDISLYESNFSWLDVEVLSRITKKKLMYYRLYAPSVTPNDQSYK